MLDLRAGRCGRKDVGGQLTRLAAVKVGSFPAPQLVKSAIEFALESIDNEGIEAGETVLIDQLIKPILPRYQEVHAPDTVFHVEGQEIFHPCGKMLGSLRFEFERFAVGALIDDPFAQRPGVDDFAHHARQRRLRRHPSYLYNQPRAEAAHRSELEPDVRLIGKSRVARDVRVDLLAPRPKLVSGDRSIECGGHDVRYQLADLRTSTVDDRPQPAHLLVEFDDA